MLSRLLLSSACCSRPPPRAPIRCARTRSRRTGTITIDGHLDEAAWTSAPKQGGLHRSGSPIDGGKPSSETQFAVLYDDEAIYVGVWASDPEPSKIRALLTRRDADSPADAIAIGFDSYHDKRTALRVPARRRRRAARHAAVRRSEPGRHVGRGVDRRRPRSTTDGWTAEYRIPLNQLRFPSGDHQEWGFQIVRIDRPHARSRARGRRGRAARRRSSASSASSTASITLPAARRLELLPYALGGVDVAPVDPGDPLNQHVTGRRNIGLDLKYGLGPAFTLSATINPDFGQVEADPSQVNLSANELFFAEKRPFFLEGVDLFKLPIGASGNTVEGAVLQPPHRRRAARARHGLPVPQGTAVDRRSTAR